MKILYFDDFRLGVLNANQEVVDVTPLLGELPRARPQELINGLIERFAAYRPALERAVATGSGIALANVHIRAPLPRPTHIDCMAVNYMEDEARSQRAPINAFMKSSSGIIGPGDTMVLPDIPASVFEGEAEFAVVIGQHASRVAEKDAMRCVFGYVNFIDGSARGLPPSGNTFYQMKARETFAPIGPWIVTADEVPDPHALQVRLWVNGVLKQDFNSRDMAHRIPRCIEFVSGVHALEPGDVLATGTNHGGLNAFQDGDTVELETERLGRLSIRVSDPLKRTWARETRLERAAKGLSGLTPQLSGKYAADTATAFTV